MWPWLANQSLPSLPEPGVWACSPSRAYQSLPWDCSVKSKERLSCSAEVVKLGHVGLWLVVILLPCRESMSANENKQGLEMERQGPYHAAWTPRSILMYINFILWQWPDRMWDVGLSIPELVGQWKATLLASFPLPVNADQLYFTVLLERLYTIKYVNRHSVNID